MDHEELNSGRAFNFCTRNGVGWTNKLHIEFKIFLHQNINIPIFLIQLFAMIKIEMVTKLVLNHAIVCWIDEQFTLEVFITPIIGSL